MYPSATEQLALAAAEKLMVATMARYDPSHDVFHGMAACGSLHLCSLTFVARARQSNAQGRQPCLLHAHFHIKILIY